MPFDDETSNEPDNAGGDIPQDTSSADEGYGAGSAPAADTWTPPSREEYEGLKAKHAQAEKLASVGSEFAPYANQIRQFIAQGFTPAQAKAEVAKAQAPEDEDDEFSHPEKYAKMWDKISTDPRSFRKLLHRESLSAGKSQFEKLSAFEKRVKDQDEKIQELMGFATLAQRRFQVDPVFQKHEKRALELVNSGKVMDLNLAFEMAQREAKLAAYEAKEGAGAAGAKKLSAKPAPRDDRSLHESRSAKGRTRGTSEPVAESKGKSRSRSALEAAAREVGI